MQRNLSDVTDSEQKKRKSTWGSWEGFEIVKLEVDPPRKRKEGPGILARGGKVRKMKTDLGQRKLLSTTGVYCSQHQRPDMGMGPRKPD